MQKRKMQGENILLWVLSKKNYVAPKIITYVLLYINKPSENV